MHTGETIQVNCAKEPEEANTMLRELGKVLIDHVQGRFKDGFHNGGHLWGQKWLNETRIGQQKVH
jgi:hypothetical protein